MNSYESKTRVFMNVTCKNTTKSLSAKYVPFQTFRKTPAFLLPNLSIVIDLLSQLSKPIIKP